MSIEIKRCAGVQVAAAHGASHVDVLTVAAAECTKILGGQVDIASHCAAQGIPLSVPPLLQLSSQLSHAW